jgi:hypothetical protein
MASKKKPAVPRPAAKPPAPASSVASTAEAEAETGADPLPTESAPETPEIEAESAIAPTPAHRAAPAMPAAPAGSGGAATLVAETASVPASPPGAGPVRTTQALAHGKTAYGARFIQSGFAITPEADLAFALGFPHLEYIVDDHPDDARAEIIAYERRSYRLGWPRNVAIRWCRITASKGCKRTPQGATELDTAGKKALKNSAPLSADEVALTLKSMFSDTSSYEDLRDLVRLFEAFFGPELVASSIVDALDKASNNVWNHQDHDRALVMHHIGFLLLRLPPALADKLRGRLAAIFDRRVKALPSKELGPRKGERGSLLRALDIVLHGRAGAERSGERSEDTIEPADLVHITGDRDFVREAACRQLSTDPRLVFLGGEPVLEQLLDRFARLRGLHHVLVDGFADVASPRAVQLLQRIAAGKEAPDRARAVLAARGL